METSRIYKTTLGELEQYMDFFSPLEETPTGRNELDEDDEKAAQASREGQHVFPLASPCSSNLS